MSQIENIFLYRIYSVLIETAGMRSTITLESLVTKCGLPFGSEGVADVVYKYLDAIASYESDNGRPMLTALITKQDQSPTHQCLKKCVALAENVAIEDTTAILKKYKNNEKLELWKTQLTKVYSQWAIPLTVRT